MSQFISGVWFLLFHINNILAAGNTSQLALSTLAAGSISGAAFTMQPVGVIQDADGNTVTTDSSSEVTMTVSDGGSVVGTATETV